MKLYVVEAACCLFWLEVNPAGRSEVCGMHLLLQRKVELVVKEIPLVAFDPSQFDPATVTVKQTMCRGSDNNTHTHRERENHDLLRQIVRVRLKMVFS